MTSYQWSAGSARYDLCRVRHVPALHHLWTCPSTVRRAQGVAYFAIERAAAARCRLMADACRAPSGLSREYTKASDCPLASRTESPPGMGSALRERGGEANLPKFVTDMK
jgi:hypothetical protein